MTNTSDLPDIRQRLGDRYAIGRELGRGGMGAVYLARDLRLDRLLINLSLNVRFTLGTKADVVQTESREPTRRSLGTLVVAASGLSVLGVSFLLLARSPVPDATG